ncbi:MAG: translation initiation factor IF-2 [Cyclobacteriaceae bacterium]|jgi:translation initiation factor IF-2
MAEGKMIRLGQAARKLNVGSSTIINFLSSKGFDIDSNPNSKVTPDQYALLAKEYADSAHDKEEASGLTIGNSSTDNVILTSTPSPSIPKPVVEKEEEILIKDNVASQESVTKEAVDENNKSESPKLQGIKVVGKIDLSPKKKAATPEKKEEPIKSEPATPSVEETPAEKTEEVVKEIPKKETAPEVPAPEKTAPKVPTPEVPTPEIETNKEPVKSEVLKAKADSLKGLTVLGKIELPKKPEKTSKPVASSDKKKQDSQSRQKRPRKRISSSRKDTPQTGDRKPSTPARGKFERKPRVVKEELTDKEIQDKIKATLAKLSGGTSQSSNVSRSKYRKEKRSQVAEAHEEKMLQEEAELRILKVTEFVSANDLASLMDVSVNEVISSCMSLGMFVSINQRLDAESITIIADEFGFNVEFTKEDEDVDIVVEEDTDEQLEDRAPIVTIMGHVDHGKTSLLDYIRDSRVTSGEAGGITQHIGAYDVETKEGKKIAFLDTPGHEAFTAMRARGAKITDIVIIVVAADDDVMPQTKEAINHAQVAGVPIVIAINKIDKPTANPDKVKESLSAINILVEEWGGKYQSQEISAKTGQGIEELLEKVLLEAELLELKANPNKKAVGSVVEATLDKGRGYVTTMMVQAGTLSVGDIVLAGSFFGKVKALFDHHGKNLDNVGPSTPVQMLGLDGAAQAGDKFNVMESDKEAREVASKREQIQREQSIRTKKHITLDEIGRRLAIGSFKELNIIVKGDVDGSVEALSDSLLKLSTSEVQVNIIHKGVGQISESDVLLASASDAIIVGFQVRPSGGAKKLAEKDEIEIRLYSIIYDAINEVKDAMEGLLAPKVEEVITGNIEVREVFKISKVGTVAGCYVTDGFVKRANSIRLIRDGIVAYEGQIGQLKRFKDDVQEVKNGYECGISIKSFNDIKEGDVIEGFEQREYKRTL